MSDPIMNFMTVNFAPARQPSAVADHASEDIRAIAHRLARDNQQADPGIVASYLFPDDQQIRLVHLDTHSPAAPDDTAIAPFYFGPDPADGISYPSAIALIRPEEKQRLTLPDGWGTWDQAEEIARENG